MINAKIKACSQDPPPCHSCASRNPPSFPGIINYFFSLKVILTPPKENSHMALDFNVKRFKIVQTNFLPAPGTYRM